MYFFNEAKGIYIEESTGAAYYTKRGASRVLGIRDVTVTNRTAHLVPASDVLKQYFGQEG